jgi:hypothetical protein
VIVRLLLEVGLSISGEEVRLKRGLVEGVFVGGGRVDGAGFSWMQLFVVRTFECLVFGVKISDSIGEVFREMLRFGCMNRKSFAGPEHEVILRGEPI